MKNEIKNPMERFISKEETYFYGDGGVSDCNDCNKPASEKPGHTGMFICSHCGGEFSVNEQNYVDPENTVCNACYAKINNRFVCSKCGYYCPCSYESSIEEVCINCYNALPYCPICGKKVIDYDRFTNGYDYCEACGKALTVTVTPSRAIVTEKESVQLTATVSNGQDLPVTWSTEDTNKISVSDDGTVTGLKNGSATVTATIPGGASDVAYINVVPPEMFTCGICKDEHSIDDESDYECVCKDCYNALPECPVCGVKVYAHNRFCDGYDYCKTCGNAITVTVTPSSATVEEGESVSLTATVSHGQDLPVTWSAGGDKVSVSDDGTVTGISAGSAIVTASIPTGASDSATITVTEPPIPPVQNTDFICGECNRPCPCRNRAYETDYCYECYRKFPICPKCLNTVIPEDRLCEGSDLCKECGEKLTVCIHPANAKVTVGKTVQLVAVISDNYELPVTWSTEDTDKILVSSEGIVTAISAGTATVTATIPGGARTTVTVEVEYDNSHVYVDYQKHHTFDCGRAGSGSVRLMDGKLSFVHHDATLTSKGMPLAISHCYDSSRVGFPSDYGTGWHLSIDQSFKKSMYKTDIYIYTDANGREHYLNKDKNGKYIDIAGLGIILSEINAEDRRNDTEGDIPTEATHQITDTGGNMMYFNSSKNLIGLRDSNGNMYLIERSDEMISKVYEKTKPADNSEQTDECGHAINFSNTFHTLNSITNYDGKKIHFNYMDNKLKKIHYPFERFDYNVINYQVSYFDYDSNGRLKSIKDPTGICISIQYYGDGKVSRMTTYGTKTVSDQSVVESDDNPIASDIGFDYGINTAVLTDMIKGTRIVYNLDSEGRELFAYEDSSVLPIEERTAVTLSSVTGYADKLDPNTKEKTTGRLVGASAYVTANASQATNLLTNSEFSSSSGWTVSANGTGSAGVVTERFVNGKNSYRFISNEPTGENKLTQTIIPPLTPDGNVYVASVWAKASGAINTVADERVQFALKVITYPPNQSKEPTVYEAKFDPSRDGEWQYAAVPIGATPNYSKIEYVLDYSGNTGTCIFSNPMLIAVDGTERYTYVDNGESFSNDAWHFDIFNDHKNIIKRVHVIEGTKFREEYYDDNYDLVKVVEHSENSSEFVTLYKYEKHNLCRVKDKYGNILDYVYDIFGRIIKAYTSPSDYSSRVRYTKRVYEDDKYYPSSETDPRYKRNGEKLMTSYEYDEPLGHLKSYTATNGQKYDYDYDSDTGNLLRLSAAAQNNGTFTNNFRYTNGYLTSVSHNGFDYIFGYDELGRTASVSVGNENLFTKSYMIGPINDADHTLYKTGEKEFVITDKRGNPRVSLYNDKEGVQHTVATTVYDKLGRVEYVIDNLRNIRYNYFYNVDGSIDYVEQRDATTDAFISTDTYSYDSAKRLISKTYGEVGHTYSPIYETTDDGAIYPDDNVIGVSLAGKFTDQIATDGLRRTATRTLTLENGAPLISDSYAYYTAVNDEDIPCTCDYVNSLTTSVCGNTAGALSYTYDKAGNIETVTENGIVIEKYYYDSINRLVREDNAANMSTYVWTYDAGGNITSKKTYGFSHDLFLGDCVRTDLYGYNSPRGWKDQLTSYNLLPITYDEIGNPITYKGIDLTWTHVRRLASYGANTFEYGADGVRTKKNNISYVLDGTKILRETDGASRNITYYYGTNGVVGFNYNGTDYYYRKNLQGDVIAIYSSTGTLVAEYVYDAWGKVTAFDLSAENIGTLNPFRYRSYYYDTETGLYYLNSRYYDPEIGRFINADDVQYLDPETLGGLSLYAYCLDNPVNMTDENGNFALPNWLKVAIGLLAITGLAVATICTAGTVAVVFGAALSGAIAGGASGAIFGAIYGGLFDGWQGALDGACTGFLSGTLIGGLWGAASAGINITTGTTTVLGKAHGSMLHKLATNMEAGKMAASGQYSQIGINTSLRKMGLNGGLARPDVIGIAKNGANMLVEVVSPKQSTNYIVNKMYKMISNNPGTVGKIVKWVRKLFA